jgi:hypothetical protein
MNVDLPPDFEDQVRDIWAKNRPEIEQAIKGQGFNDILILPPTPDLGDLSAKMKMENGYYDGISSNSAVPDLKGLPSLTSPNAGKIRILLVHDAKELDDRPDLKATLNIPGNEVKPGQAMSLEDYLTLQRKYFEDTGEHLDEKKYTWLSTKHGVRLVNSSRDPGDRELCVYSDGLDYRYGPLGLRPARCFTA